MLRAGCLAVFRRVHNSAVLLWGPVPPPKVLESDPWISSLTGICIEKWFYFCTFTKEVEKIFDVELGGPEPGAGGMIGPRSRPSISRFSLEMHATRPKRLLSRPLTWEWMSS